jgi:hypothetical protein
MGFVRNFAVVVAFLAISIPIFLSLQLGGWAAKWVSPPYSFNDIPGLDGAEQRKCFHLKSFIRKICNRNWCKYWNWQG